MNPLETPFGNPQKTWKVRKEAVTGEAGKPGEVARSCRKE